MRNKSFLFVIIFLLVAALAPLTVNGQDEKKIKIGFLPGVVDPFYQVMELGVNQAASDLGVELVTQIPDTWSASTQTPILDAMVARGDLDYLIISPVDDQQMIAPLQAAYDAGIKIIIVDTNLGNGDFVNGPVTFPIARIGSDSFEGGKIAGKAMAEALGGKGKVFIQNTNVGVSNTELRSKGFQAAIAEYPDIELVGEEYSLDSADTATQQTAAVLQRVPDLGGIFGVNVFSAQGAGNAVVAAGLGGQVQVMAFDATQFAVEQLNAGVVTLVIAQKPYDIGYLAVEFAMADHRGVTSLPRSVTTGFAVIDSKNVTDPDFSRFIYQVPGQ